MTKRLRGVRWLALAALVAGVVAVPSALADDPQFQFEALGSGKWFVQMTGQPTAAGGSESAAKAEQAAFKAEAKKAGVSFKERYAFNKLWNGLSIQTGADVTTLKGIKGVKAVYPVLTAPIPDTQTISPDLTSAIQMTGADIVQNSLGFDGSGVKVAVMDTGLDLDHADLGGDGVAGGTHVNSRVVAQWDFVGDAYDANPGDPGYDPVPHPDPVADDCAGHGTHVSGIVGANGTATGVAPGVEFGAYRVFGCVGSTDSDIMIAAMERVLQDDMDVLNMSIGSAFQTWPQYPTAAAADQLANNGVVVVASIGNSGADGVYSAGAPGVGDNVIGTASFENTTATLNFFSASNGGPEVNIGYLPAAGAPAPPSSGSLPLVKANAVGAVPPGTLPNADGCSAVAAGTYTAQAVLVRRGTCTFYAKAKIAQDGGAAAVVLYNNAPANIGFVSPTVAGSPPITIPVVATSDELGLQLHNMIVAGPTTMTWQSGTATVPNSTGGTISSFSSFGLTAELTLKPDIGAPGGLINSTYPLELGGYATISGTSMASPHVAGAVALLLEAQPNIPRKRVRDVLQNSADPQLRLGQTHFDPAHRQGAGLLDIDDAILATTWLKPGKISLGDGNGGTETIELTNKSHSAVTYDVSHEPAAGTTNTFPAVAFSTLYATASFSSPSVVVPAGGSATVDVTITPNAGLANRAVYGGYIKFTPQGDGQEYRVPYAGMKGDYQSITVMNFGVFVGQLASCSRLSGFDCLAGGSYFLDPPSSYSMADAFNIPIFITHLNHQARSLTVDVRRVSDDKWMGAAVVDEYLPRNQTPGGIFVWSWDGTLHNGNNTESVADGTYYLKATLMKALGNPSNAEVAATPDIVIDRP